MVDRSPHPSKLNRFQAREYEHGINDVLVNARYLVNSFHVTVRAPPELLGMTCSYLTSEDDMFSASQVCRHWRAVLISSPSLWTRFPCRRVSRTIVALERCKSFPIQIEFSQQSSSVALENVLLRGAKIASLTVDNSLDLIPQLHQLFIPSGPFVEQLHILCEDQSMQESREEIPHEFWQDLPSLRQLFVRQYSIPLDQLSAPNLVHLTLEGPICRRGAPLQSILILNTLRGCPRLETLLISDSRGGYENLTGDYSLVSLPHLRSIELGTFEVYSDLVTHLQFPPNIAAGFRLLRASEVCGYIPLAMMATMQHVLKRVDIYSITLAIPPFPQDNPDLLIRFEGLQASLEMTAYADTYEKLRDVFFGPKGVLSSHSPRIEDVKELHIIGCPFVDSRVLDHFDAAMPNVVSISLFDCEGPDVFGPLTPTNTSPPPFQHLERIMVLGSESGLGGMVKARRDHGVPLRTLVVGRGSGEFDYNHVEDYAALEEYVDELRTGCPTEIVEWGSENEIFNLWSAAQIPCPVCPFYENLMVLGSFYSTVRT